MDTSLYTLKTLHHRVNWVILIISKHYPLSVITVHLVTKLCGWKYYIYYLVELITDLITRHAESTHFHNPCQLGKLFSKLVSQPWSAVFLI